jgi:beta-glucosidase
MTSWPAGFMWGTGASSTQCEGAAPASDWIDWERAGRAPVSGAGSGFGTRYAEDFAIYASLGLTHHRLSIEWARVEPSPGEHPPEVVEHYRAMLTAARDAGVEPWVCLHHFTLPRWFQQSGAFLVRENRTDVWARHVDWMADTFGDLVFGWQPVNETNYYAQLAYRAGAWPPGHNDRGEWGVVNEAIQLATAEAAVRLKQAGKPVASIFGLGTAFAHDDRADTQKLVDRIYENNWDAGLHLFRDGVLRVPGRDPVVRPDLAGSFDLIGFSYYSATGVRQGRAVVHPEGAPRSPLGYGIWPDGLWHVLRRLHAEVPGTPLLVAEYGIGTDDDAERAAYIRRGLELTADAIAQGIDVRGFFHWTGVDNYEWIHGYDVKFGIIDADRTIRPSAQVLAKEALQ